MDLNLLTGLKDFLSERTELAILALSLVANVIQFRLIWQLHESRFQVAVALLPVTDRMQRMIEAAAKKARRKNTTTSGEE